MLKIISIISLLTVTTLLSGCSREPTQDELYSLYNEKIQTTNQLAEKITRQKGSIIQIKSFEKIDCQKVADSKDYSCRIKSTVALPYLGDQTSTANIQVTKDDQGWVMLD